MSEIPKTNHLFWLSVTFCSVDLRVHVIKNLDHFKNSNCNATVYHKCWVEHNLVRGCNKPILAGGKQQQQQQNFIDYKYN